MARLQTRRILSFFFSFSTRPQLQPAEPREQLGGEAEDAGIGGGRGHSERRAHRDPGAKSSERGFSPLQIMLAFMSCASD